MQRAKLATLSQAGGTNSRLLLPGGREGVRTSPRKRLTLNDTPPSSSIPSPSLGHLFHLSPEKAGKTSPLTKKLKLDPTISGTSPEVAMKGLNQVQLANLLSSLLDRHPDLREEVRQLMPTPDLAHLEERLNEEDQKLRIHSHSGGGRTWRRSLQNCSSTKETTNKPTNQPTNQPTNRKLFFRIF